MEDLLYLYALYINKEMSQFKIPEIVMFIDAVMLNETVIDFKKHFEEMLQRPIQNMDVAQFIVNLALDSNITGLHNEVQVVFVYDESTLELSHCTPSSLELELDAVDFRDSLGVFSLTSTTSHGMATREDHFSNLLHIYSESDMVKQLILIPHEGESLKRTIALLHDATDKEVVLFSMNNPPEEIGFTWQMLAYPIMQAMGIKGEEIG